MIIYIDIPPNFFEWIIHVIQERISCNTYATRTITEYFIRYTLQKVKMYKKNFYSKKPRRNYAYN